jgi:hypothetical protein
MNNKPKRPWFRFHLLTAVLMMFAAGGVIGVNTCERVFREYQTMPDSANSESRLLRTQLWGMGWPFCYFQTRATVVRHKGDWDLGPNHEPIEKMPLAGDIIIGVGIVIALAFVSEFLLRRREGRKTPAPP